MKRTEKLHDVTRCATQSVTNNPDQMILPELPARRGRGVAQMVHGPRR